eukprot:TRINITY_DN6335_c0_g1_i2.p1 TRINITY_DN6335_c0_g1~~TRINITY_DN6335_c0_g1_i2.p1  ORF type:complete len:692 (-),score=245.79 TRINITY_DN6335_c0_g1_i2:174-2249(-)
MAAEVVAKCKLLSESRTSQVEAVLRLMQHRIHDLAAGQFQESEIMDGGLGQSQELYTDKLQQHAHITLDHLDEVIEQLYEENIDDKIEAARKVLVLCKDVDNLDFLAQHEQLLGIMSRLLRDDGRRSMELAQLLVQIFYIFSTFSQFHPVILNNQVGDMIMKMILLEIRRHNQRKDDIAKTSDSSRAAEMQTRLVKQCMRQERLLAVCFNVLLNVAEDVSIEKKMKKRGICSYLCQMLERTNLELLLVSLMFLKKLSIFKENIVQMKENTIVSKLNRFLSPGQNDGLMHLSLRLMFNLSFDPELRDEMADHSMIPKLVELLKLVAFRPVVLKLLYHFSTDERCKSIFVCTDCIPLVLQMLVGYSDNTSTGSRELLGLAVNLATNSRNAEMMCGGDGLHMLFKRLFKTMDPILMKVIRNCAQHDGSFKSAFKEYVQDLVILAKQTANPDLLVEVLGTLGNLTGKEVDFPALIHEYGLIAFFEQHLRSGVVEDDILLEVIVFIGTVCHDPQVAPMVANSSLVQALFDLLGEKQEDDEIVLQVVYVFYRLVVQPETRYVLLQQTNAIHHIIELLADANLEIRKMADQALELIMELDDDLGKQIRHRKFAVHNEKWLSLVDGVEPEDTSYDYDQQDPDGFEPSGDDEYLDGQQEGEFMMGGGKYSEEDEQFDQDIGDFDNYYVDGPDGLDDDDEL